VFHGGLHGGEHLGLGHGAGAVGHGPVAGVGTHGPSSLTSGLSPINFFTLMAFLAWFGGTGYLLTRYAGIWFAIGLGIATLSGITGASIIFLFLTRVLLAHEAALQQESLEMVGVLGKLGVGIRMGGTGEIIYSHGGTRHVSAARSEDGCEIQKGAEVVVTRYEKGIAYVRRWEDMTQ
jgi:membrane protein implicated in regulation of membrane protease activity